LIAFGGIQGKVGILDSITMQYKGLYDAHSCEVKSLSFNDSQSQMITISIEGEVALWNAQKMTIVQTIRH
jgi:WD40 repeat protein